MYESIKKFKQQPLFLISLSLFIVLTAWWMYINFFWPTVTTYDRQLFAACYQVLALFGAIIGFWMSKRWGGYSSVLGRSLIFFSLGLLLQSFGQTVYSYFIFFEKISVPYPSVGDVGFFGTVVAYIAAVAQLSKVAGFHFSWKSMQNKVSTILIPLVILLVSYFFFLKGYTFDWSQKLKIFLDFGYPLGEAIYVSIALLTLVVSRNILGGVMKKPIRFLILALLVQYSADFMFLYQANNGTWNAGYFNDYLYCISYFLMSIALIYVGGIFNKIKENK